VLGPGRFLLLAEESFPLLIHSRVTKPLHHSLFHCCCFISITEKSEPRRRRRKSQYYSPDSTPYILNSNTEKQMASTFRRKPRATVGSPAATATADDATSGTFSSQSATSASTVLLPGCKAWTSGTVLVSTGLRELDNQLAATTGNTGGQPLRTCLYLEEDRLGDSASCLVRYWCAEVSGSTNITYTC